MVQSMIGQVNEDKRILPQKLGTRSNKNAGLNVAEDSVGKATEDFGGYSMEDGPQSNGRAHPLGYERNYEESGLEHSPIRQRA